MTATKQYLAGEKYEKKLRNVMERFKVKEFNWNYDRHGAWVELRYKGQLYRFDHTVQNARARGVALDYGSDAFAQIVLSLEDLARMVERGIYDLQTWVAGMKMLPGGDGDSQLPKIAWLHRDPCRRRGSEDTLQEPGTAVPPRPGRQGRGL